MAVYAPWANVGCELGPWPSYLITLKISLRYADRERFRRLAASYGRLERKVPHPLGHLVLQSVYVRRGDGLARPESGGAHYQGQRPECVQSH